MDVFVWLKANMPTRRSYCVPESKIIVCSRKAANAGGNFRIRNVSKFIAIELDSEEVDQKLKEIMLNIHSSCVKYGSDSNGYVDYVKGANIAGFVKVAGYACSRSGINLFK
jgi:glutamate dehydrogenase (NADP+)